MSTLVKLQHYVWRFYLKPWTNRKNSLYCYRQKADKLFGSNVTGIAGETFFYRVERLSSTDIEYLNGIINLAASPEMRDIHQNTIRLFQMPFTMRDQFEAMSNGRPLSSKLNKLLEDAEKTAGEQYHTMTEQSGMWFLDRLREEDCSFFTDKEKVLDFSHYLSHQFFRTPKLKNLLANMDNPFGDLDLKRVWFFQSHILADNIGASIFLSKDHYRFLFLKNKSQIPFITTDQPVINLNTDKDKNLRLLYPLTPQLAVVFFEDEASPFKTTIELSKDEVDCYNQLMFNRSYDQLYSNDKDYLSGFMIKDKMIGGS